MAKNTINNQERVTGPVDPKTGKRFQQYFRAGDPKADDADRRQQKLVKTKSAHRNVAAIPTRQNPYTCSGVESIRMVIEGVKKSKNKHSGNINTASASCYLIIQATTIYSTPLKLKRKVTPDTVSSTFLMILDKLREGRGLRTIPPEWKTRNPPTKERFLTLIKKKKKEGVDVGELLKQFK